MGEPNAQNFQNLPNIEKLYEFKSNGGYNSVNVVSTDGFRIGFYFADSHGHFGRPTLTRSTSFGVQLPRCDYSAVNSFEQIEIVEYAGL